MRDRPAGSRVILRRTIPQFGPQIDEAFARRLRRRDPVQPQPVRPREAKGADIQQRHGRRRGTDGSVRYRYVLVDAQISLVLDLVAAGEVLPRALALPARTDEMRNQRTVDIGTVFLVAVSADIAGNLAVLDIEHGLAAGDEDRVLAAVDLRTPDNSGEQARPMPVEGFEIDRADRLDRAGKSSSTSRISKCSRCWPMS
jgi:hypothetical protein